MGALDELGVSGEQRDFLIREKRKRDSVVGGLMDFGAAPEGQKRASILPMISPEGMSGWDALTSGQAQLALPGMVTGAVEGAARALDLPRAAYDRQIPPSDMAGEALNLAGMTSLGAASTAGRGLFDYDPTTTRSFAGPRTASVDETGALRFSNALPEPRNEAEAIAKTILELRATGNVDAVTERMMDAADPQYMYAYTPLPMDEASRMARAREIGYGKDRYHGNNADVAGFRGSVFSSDNPTVASTYNRGMLDAQIYPIMTREGPMGSVTVEGAGSNWNQFEPEMIGDIAVARGSALYPNEVTGKLSTRNIEKAAKFEGKSGVTFKDIKDLGPGFNSQQFKNLGYTPEQEAAMRQQYLTELSKPSEVDVRLSPNLVRSRFARFDPMFSHLRNLSAGVAPFGLLAMPSNKEQK